MSQESGNNTNTANNYTNLFDSNEQVKKIINTHSKTQQPGTHTNLSKRLSQKSSARQFQVQAQLAQGFSPGRKLQNLPAHVQQQIMRGMNNQDQQMIYRQMEDSRNQNMLQYNNPQQNKSVSNQGLRGSF